MAGKMSILGRNFMVEFTFLEFCILLGKSLGKSFIILGSWVLAMASTNGISLSWTTGKHTLVGLYENDGYHFDPDKRITSVLRLAGGPDKPEPLDCVIAL